jgi:hypothetical protein
MGGWGGGAARVMRIGEPVASGSCLLIYICMHIYIIEP